MYNSLHFLISFARFLRGMSLRYFSRPPIHGRFCKVVVKAISFRKPEDMKNTKYGKQEEHYAQNKLIQTLWATCLPKAGVLGGIC